METEAEATTNLEWLKEHDHPHQTQLDLNAIILELRQAVATINNETHTMFNHYLSPKMTTNNQASSVT